MLSALVTTMMSERVMRQRATSRHRRAACHADDRPIRHERGRECADGSLFGFVLRFSVAQRQLDVDPVRDRAAVDFQQQALFMQGLQITAQGRLQR